MESHHKNFMRLFKSSLCVLVIYSSLRFLLYGTYYRGISFSGFELLESFIHGVRFDLYCIGLATIPQLLIIVCFLVGINHQKVILAGRFLFIVIHCLFLTPIIANLGYFKFIERHLGKDIFSFSKEASEQNISLLTNYWHLLLVSFITFWIIYKTAPRYKAHTQKPPKTVFIFVLVLMCIAGLCVRGGLQSKPLAPVHAYLNSDERLANISLNTSFNILRSSSAEEIPSFIQTAHQGIHTKQLDQSHTKRVDVPVFKDSNIVLLIVESLALEYLNINNDKASWAPFISEIANNKKNAFFPKFFANGRRSIDISPSIQAGLPNFLDQPFVRSSFQHVKLNGLAEILSFEGYDTSFFHGTKNNSMYFDSFAARVGFKQYHGLDNYPHKGHYNGYWGIFDEEFLQHSVKVLSRSSKPFFTSIFTLSSHDPFVVPDKHKEKFKSGPLKIHKTISYSDYAVKKFFESAKKEGWYENTIFIITADHAYSSEQVQFQDLIGKFRVPLIIMHPNKDLSAIESEKIGQHIDIKPTILDLVGHHGKGYSGFGRSLLRKDQQGFAFNKLGKVYWYLDKDKLIKLNSNGEYFSYSHKNTWDLSLDKIKDEQTKNHFIQNVLEPYFKVLRN